MSRTLPSLAIAGSLLAALSALVLADLALLLPAGFAIGAGIYLTISKDWRRWAPGAIAILFAVLGIMGTIGSIGGEDGEIAFPISISMGAVLIFIACLEFPTVLVLQKWGNHNPAWLGLVLGGLLIAADLLALIFNKDIIDHSAPTTLVVGILALATLWPGIDGFREA